MRIAVTAWGNRVSPVFDSARTLLIADIENQAVTRTTYKSFHPDDMSGLAELLKRLDAPTLICGAISTQPAEVLTAHRIKLISFVSGNALEILSTFARRNTVDEAHMMPGLPTSHQG
ncbi:MAG: NifB/NifX family molybdenum-iron cluster-binding protein [Desulfobacterales bacterium]|nr:NifB/NifX family molybdenum-iron cluster-binding protein [Desulfobacterales bacterium]